MSAEQIALMVVALTVAAFALAGSFAASRALRRTGTGLRRADLRLATLATAIPARATAARARLADVEVETEHALWTLGNLDARLGHATADLLAKRVASDSLRLRLIEGRLTIARLRQLVRLLIRLGEMRRVFL